MEIIKRHGKKVRFDERKLYASIYAAALTAEYGEKRSEKFASSVVKTLKKKVKNKTVTSDFLRKHAIEILNKKDKEVAFLYKTHLDLS